MSDNRIDLDLLKKIFSMRDEDGEPTFLGKLACYLHTPGTYNTDWEGQRFEHGDDIWHHEEIFDGDYHLIENSREWYESPNVATIYTDHKYIFNQNMSLDKPTEKYYEQNVDTNEFMAKMYVEEDLPSDRGELKIHTTIDTKSPPSEENNFALMEYSVELSIRYGRVKGITWLPRMIANPLNSMFRYYFVRYIGEEMLEYDIEYSRERFREYFDYIRKYHGEEPVQTKSRQAHFKTPYDGVFFE